MELDQDKFTLALPLPAQSNVMYDRPENYLTLAA